MKSTLHDLSDPEYLERFPLDMDQVTRDAMRGLSSRRWRLEFDCSGAPFVWTGNADCEAEAAALGRMAIYMDGRHDQDAARVVVCVEVSS